MTDTLVLDVPVIELPVETLHIHGSPNTVAPKTPSQIDSGEAGRSALRHHGQRMAAREAHIRSHHPRIGGLLLAVTPQPKTTAAWAEAAIAERLVAVAIGRLGHRVVALHDRSMRGRDGSTSCANIDLLVVAQTGVWIIEVMADKGNVDIRRSGPLLRPVHDRILIGKHDRTRTMKGVHGQMDAVRAVLDRNGETVPVHAAVCLVNAKLPFFTESFMEVPLLDRRVVRKRLVKRGPYTVDDRMRIATILDGAFPQA